MHEKQCTLPILCSRRTHSTGMHIAPAMTQENVTYVFRGVAGIALQDLANQVNEMEVSNLQ